MYKIKCVCFNEIIWLTITKRKMKTKNISHRYNLNKRPWPRHGHKYSKNKKWCSMVMFICIKEPLRNIWSSINEKVK